MISVTSDTLQHLYVERDMTMNEISKELGISVGSVYNYIKKFGIPPREGMRPQKRAYVGQRVSEALKGRKRKPFTEEHRRKISESLKGKFSRPTRFGGHRKKRADGYIYIYCPNHPYASAEGYVMEHVLVMEAQVGRYITREYVVHHKNHIRDDNRIENLELMTFSEHAKLHLEERTKNKTMKYHTVMVRNVETGEEFVSVKGAGEKYGVKGTNIVRACKHPNRTVRGFHWEYI